MRAEAPGEREFEAPKSEEHGPPAADFRQRSPPIAKYPARVGFLEARRSLKRNTAATLHLRLARGSSLREKVREERGCERSEQSGATPITVTRQRRMRLDDVVSFVSSLGLDGRRN